MGNERPQGGEAIQSHAPRRNPAGWAGSGARAKRALNENIWFSKNATASGAVACDPSGVARLLPATGPSHYPLQSSLPKERALYTSGFFSSACFLLATLRTFGRPWGGYLITKPPGLRCIGIEKACFFKWNR